MTPRAILVGLGLATLTLAASAVADDGVPLRISTDPPGATVTVDGRAAGRTPTELSLPRGRTRAVVGLALDGYESVVVEIRTGGRPSSLRLPLEALFGRIVVDSDEDGEPAYDGRVTLREALAYARGDLVPRGADARGVVGTVGRDHRDRIEFHPGTFGAERFVFLRRPLPALDDPGDALLGPPQSLTLAPAAGLWFRGAGLTLGPSTEASRLTIDGFDVGVAASGFGRAVLRDLRILGARVGVQADDGCSVDTQGVSADADFAPRLVGGTASIAGDVRAEPARVPGRATVRRTGAATRPLLVVEGDGRLRGVEAVAYARHAQRIPLSRVVGLAARSSTYDAYHAPFSSEEAFQKWARFAVDGKADAFQWAFRGPPEREWLRVECPRPLRTSRLRIVHLRDPSNHLVRYLLRLLDRDGTKLFEKEVAAQEDADVVEVGPEIDFRTIVVMPREARGTGPGIVEIEAEVLDCDEVPALAASRRQAVFPGGDPLTSGRDGAFSLGGRLQAVGSQAFVDAAEFATPTSSDGEASEPVTRVRVTRDGDTTADDDGLTLREAFALVAGSRPPGAREAAFVDGASRLRFVVELGRDVRLTAPLPEVKGRQLELRGGGFRLGAAEPGRPVFTFSACNRLAILDLTTDGTLRAAACEEVQLRNVAFTACGDVGVEVDARLVLASGCRFATGHQGLSVARAEVHLVESRFDGLNVGASLPSYEAHAVLGNTFTRTPAPFQFVEKATGAPPWLLLFGNRAEAGSAALLPKEGQIPQTLAEGNAPVRLGLPRATEARGRGRSGRALVDLSDGRPNATVAHVDLGLAWGGTRIVRADGGVFYPGTAFVTLLFAEPLTLWFQAGDVVTKHALAPAVSSAAPVATLTRLDGPAGVGRNTPRLFTALAASPSTRVLAEGRPLPVFATPASEASVDREIARLTSGGRLDLALHAALVALDRWPSPTSAARVADVAEAWSDALEKAGRFTAADALYVRLTARVTGFNPFADAHARLLERAAGGRGNAKAWPEATALMGRALALRPDDPRLGQNAAYYYQQWAQERIRQEPYATVAAWLDAEAARLPTIAALLERVKRPLVDTAMTEALRKKDHGTAFDLAAAQHTAESTDRTRQNLQFAFQEWVRGLLAEGKHREAIDAYRSASARFPLETDFARIAALAVQTAAEALVPAGRGDAAVALAVDLHGAAKTTDSMNVLGSTLFAVAERSWKDDAPEVSLKVWTDAVARLPAVAELKQLAAKYANSKAVPISGAKRYAMAVRIFRWGLGVLPGDQALLGNAAITYGNWAISESNAKNHAKALEIADEGLRLFPADARLQQVRDRSRKALGR